VCKRLKHFIDKHSEELWKLRCQYRWSAKPPKNAKEYYRSRNEDVNKNWKDGTCTFSCLWGHSEKVRCLSFDEGLSRIATGSQDTVIKLWELFPGRGTTRRCLLDLRGHDAPVTAVRFAPEAGKLLSSSFDTKLMVWDIERGESNSMKIAPLIESKKAYLYDLCTNPRGTNAVVAVHDGTVRLLDLQAKSPTGVVLQAHKKAADNAVLNLAWDGGHYVVSGSQDKVVRVWDVRMPDQWIGEQLHKGLVTALFWDGVNRKYAFAACGKTALQFRLPIEGGQMKTVAKFPNEKVEGGKLGLGHTDNITSMWSFSGTLVTGSNDRSIRVWSTKSGKGLVTYSGYSGNVFAVQCNRDIIVSGSVRTVNIWDFSSRK